MLSKTIVVMYRPREPFEIAALILCLFATISQAVYGATPGSASAAMPFLIQVIWLLLVGVGSALTLTGVMLFHRALTGIVMEIIGLTALTAGLALNGVGAMVLALTGDINSRAAVTGPLSLSWALAAWVRMRRVRGEMKKLEQASDDQDHSHVSDRGGSGG